jgi:hypothetical protein
VHSAASVDYPKLSGEATLCQFDRAKTPADEDA